MKEPGELAWEAFTEREPHEWYTRQECWSRVESAIRADERAKVDGEIERLKSENIRLRETLGETLHAVCRAARAALEEEKP